MFHRVMAVLIFGLVLGTVIVAHRKLGARHFLSRTSLLWLGLILAQATLGALTVLKYKPADIATLHVLFGALSLGTGVLSTVISRTKENPSHVSETESSEAAMTEAEAV
jgi:heme A synthase